MKVNIHIRDWMTTVHCGLGNQPIKWLCDVSLFKYDQNYNMDGGTPCGLKFNNGTDVNFNA